MTVEENSSLIVEKLTANIIFNGKNEFFLYMMRKKARCPLLSGGSIVIAIRQNRNRRHLNWKRRSKTICIHR